MSEAEGVTSNADRDVDRDVDSAGKVERLSKK